MRPCPFHFVSAIDFADWLAIVQCASQISLLKRAARACALSLPRFQLGFWMLGCLS